MHQLSPRDVEDSSAGNSLAPANTGLRANDLGSSYRPSQSIKWAVLPAISLLHFGAFFALMSIGVFGQRAPHSRPLQVNLVSLERQAPEQQRPPPARKPNLPDVPVPRIVAPVPAIKLSAVYSPVAAVSDAAPGPAAVVEEPRNAAPTADPVPEDLSLKLISANPPSYPVESRRKREEGVVVLEVVVGEDGSVDEIFVKRGSGYDRLDRAALSAVRKWRWTPTLVDGMRVRVRGVVRMPFELRS